MSNNQNPLKTKIVYLSDFEIICMPKLVVLTIVSYIIGFIFLHIIRSYDKYDKEPLGRLVLFSFLGGLVSIGVASFIYLFVHPKFNITDAILKVGTVEEFAKLATLFILYKIIRKLFDEIVDGIIYVAAIALGFSVIENIFYAINAASPFALLAQRFLFATIGHISFSVYMGIAFYIHKNIHKNYIGLILAYVISVLAHGLYDGFIFEKQFAIFFIPTYLFFVFMQFRLLKVAYAYSTFKLKISPNNLSLSHQKNNTSCCNCHQQGSNIYLFNNIKVDICLNCEHIIIEESGFKKILKYFRPKLNKKKYIKSIKSSQNNIFLDQQEQILYHHKKQRINANIYSLNTWLQNENKTDLNKYHKTIEGFIFNFLGFKYIKN